MDVYPMFPPAPRISLEWVADVLFAHILVSAFGPTGHLLRGRGSLLPPGILGGSYSPNFNSKWPSTEFTYFVPAGHFNENAGGSLLLLTSLCP